MKLKVGKWYRRSDGVITKINEIIIIPRLQNGMFKCIRGNYYYPDGVYADFTMFRLDLIEELGD